MTPRVLSACGATPARPSGAGRLSVFLCVWFILSAGAWGFPTPSEGEEEDSPSLLAKLTALVPDGELERSEAVARSLSLSYTFGALRGRAWGRAGRGGGAHTARFSGFR